MDGKRIVPGADGTPQTAKPVPSNLMYSCPRRRMIANATVDLNVTGIIV